MALWWQERLKELKKPAWEPQPLPLPLEERQPTPAQPDPPKEESPGPIIIELL